MTDLKKLVKRIWSKIGPRTMHTNERLREFKILKIEDELKIAEMKLVWRWEKKKIPAGIKNVLNERTDERLRNRKFIRDVNWKTDSISYRIATRANNSIKDIEIARSKRGLKNKIKNTCLLTEYNRPCTIRNCFICSNN